MTVTYNTALGAKSKLGTAVEAGAFTTIDASGQITSTVASGTAPLVVASTTQVAKLNAASLGGATFTAPGAIGGTTANAGNFTDLKASHGFGAFGALNTAQVPALTTVGVASFVTDQVQALTTAQVATLCTTVDGLVSALKTYGLTQ